jgi:hypothetical protein
MDKPLPQVLQNMPQLDDGLQLYWLAFWQLISERSGMGDGPIRWTAIQEWCRYNGLSREQTEAVHHHLRVMCSVVRKHYGDARRIRSDHSEGSTAG